MLALVVILFSFIQVNASPLQSTSDETARTNIDHSITFQEPLTVLWRDEDGRTHELTAFRFRRNDEILKEVRIGITWRVPRLRWVSYGRPVFVRSIASRSSVVDETNAIRSYFHFTPSGFYSRIQMLTDQQRALLVRQARRETHLKITTHQIGNLPLTEFKCSLVFHDENGKKYLIKGTVGDLKSFPLRMDFEAPLGTIERERLIRTRPDDVVFHCRFSTQAQINRTSNKLSITSQQLQDIRIEEKLFGVVGEKGTNEVYVSTRQILELASEVYSALDIMEDYEVSESVFRDAFAAEIVRQLSSQQFSQVPIDTVLGSISKYSLDSSSNLTADRITSDLGRILKVEQVGNKSRIAAARPCAMSSERATRMSVEEPPEASGTLMGLGSAAIKIANDFACNNAIANIDGLHSLDDQLKELNRLSKNEAEWEIEGDKVTPKSLNVAKLSRARFSNDITFKNIRVQTSDSADDFSIKLYLRTALNTAGLSVEEQPVSCENFNWMRALVAGMKETQLHSEQRIIQQMQSIVQSIQTQQVHNRGSAAVHRPQSTGEGQLSRGPLIHVIDGDTHVGALTSFDNQLFVAREGEGIDVYNTVNFEFERRITINGAGTRLVGMAPCGADHNCLYVSDINNNKIHKLNVSLEHAITPSISWSVAKDPHGLHVNRDGNLLVATGAMKVQEYTSNGSLVREIYDGNHLCQAVELVDGTIAVSRMSPVHGVAVLSVNGTALRQFGSTTTGTGPGVLNSPRGIAVSKQGDVLVAEFGNNRIVTLDPTLSTARILSMSTLSPPLSQPQVVWLDDSNERLYVAEWWRPFRVLVFDFSVLLQNSITSPLPSGSVRKSSGSFMRLE